MGGARKARDLRQAPALGPGRRERAEEADRGHPPPPLAAPQTSAGAAHREHRVSADSGTDSSPQAVTDLVAGDLGHVFPGVPQTRTQVLAVSLGPLFLGEMQEWWRVEGSLQPVPDACARPSPSATSAHGHGLPAGTLHAGSVAKPFSGQAVHTSCHSPSGASWRCPGETSRLPPDHGVQTSLATPCPPAVSFTSTMMVSPPPVC